LFTLQGSGEDRALLDPVTVSLLHPKILDPMFLLCSLYVCRVCVRACVLCMYI